MQLNYSLIALGLGGLSGVVANAIDMAFLGTASVEVETILKYAVPVTGIIWLGGRKFQEIKDELAKAAHERLQSQLTLRSVCAAILEIRSHCSDCNLKGKSHTRFEVPLEMPPGP